MKYLLLLFPLALQGAAVIQTTCSPASAHSISCHFITDTVSDPPAGTASVIKVRLSPGGKILKTRARKLPGGKKTHGVLVGALSASTAHYLTACSTIGGVEVCGTEQTVVTPAAAANNDPIQPASVDKTGTVGGGKVLDVHGTNCLDASTGLQARLTQAALGDVIRIPLTTYNCTAGMIWADKGAGTAWTKLTTAGTRLPPAGVRTDCAMFDCSKIYRTVINMTDVGYAPGGVFPTGTSTLLNYSPGYMFFKNAGSTWGLSKNALDGKVVTLTGCTVTTPIVCTTSSPHGIAAGNPACIKGALGMIEIRGCFTTASNTSTTFALKLRDGTNTVGVHAYTGGGSVQGLIWTPINPTTSFAGNLVGACPTVGAWGRNTSAASVGASMFKCGRDLRWYHVDTPHSHPPDADGVLPEGALNATVGGHHLQVSHIQFADPPWPPEPEWSYGPRNSGAGYATGGTYVGSRGSHHIWFTQCESPVDLTQWRTNSQFEGVTTDVIIEHFGMISAGGYQVAYIPEGEMYGNAISFTNSLGKVHIDNNRFKIAGMAYFAAESRGFTEHGDITFTRNYVDGVCDMTWGGVYDRQTIGSDYGPILFLVRQFFELKTGRRVKIAGNYFGCLQISSTPTAPAIAFGTQSGLTDQTQISASGVLTPPPSFPKPLSLAANQRIMLTSSRGVNPKLFKVASVVSNVVTLKELDGSKYASGVATSAAVCTLDVAWNPSDVLIENNTSFNTHQFWQAFGWSYQNGDICLPGPVDRVIVRNNVSTLKLLGQMGGFPIGSIGVTAHRVGGQVDHVQIYNNTAVTPDPKVTAFNDAFDSNGEMDHESSYIRVENNFLPAENRGIAGDYGVGGTTLMDLRWPNGTWTFRKNVYIRSDGTPISGEPRGNFFSTLAKVNFANVAVGDFRLKPASTYRGSTSTDGNPPGADLHQLEVAQGVVTSVQALGEGNGELRVRWIYDGGAACTAYRSNTRFATYTRAPSAASTRQQTVLFTGVTTGSWSVRILCPGSVAPVVTVSSLMQ